ncbi:MAG: ABC transporter permease [Acidimicrobiia bacterium]|nr:ABC transporter permease [Acidimicrobiia bacterium]
MSELSDVVVPGSAQSPRSVAWARRRRAAGEVWAAFRRHRQAMAGLIILLAVTVMALVTPLLADRTGLSAVDSLDNPVWASPSGDFFLGTDNLGRSVAVQFLYGSRTSLLVGVAATMLIVVIGSLVGVIAGFIGGWVDSILMRLSDWFLVIPFLPLAIVLARILGPSIWNIIFVIGVTSWPYVARITRAQVLSLRQRLFVERARALGASRRHIVRQHILPNVAPLILANATLAVPIAILTETTLAFLGLGDSRNPSWGKSLEEAYTAGAITRNAWWYYLPAGIGIIAVVLAFTMCGRALEEILDPRLRERR